LSLRPRFAYHSHGGSTVTLSLKGDLQQAPNLHYAQCDAQAHRFSQSAIADRESCTASARTHHPTEPRRSLHERAPDHGEEWLCSIQEQKARSTFQHTSLELCSRSPAVWKLELAITNNTKLSHAPATKNNPESLLWVARGWSGSLSQSTIFDVRTGYSTLT
jgi:hypothetical protein